MNGVVREGALTKKGRMNSPVFDYSYLTPACLR